MTNSIKSLALGAIALGLGACAVASEEGNEPVSREAEELRQFCGGIAAFTCPDGYVCVDDPSDDCDPDNGGADCGGICKRGAKPKPSGKCKYGDPNKTWVSKDPEQCAAILFICESGQAFFDECGCGCLKDAGTPCGSTTCGTGEYCCNESCSICAPEGGFCTMQVCG